MVLKWLPNVVRQSKWQILMKHSVFIAYYIVWVLQIVEGIVYLFVIVVSKWELSLWQAYHILFLYIMLLQYSYIVWPSRNAPVHIHTKHNHAALRLLMWCMIIGCWYRNFLKTFLLKLICTWKLEEICMYQNILLLQKKCIIVHALYASQTLLLNQWKTTK